MSARTQILLFSILRPTESGVRYSRDKEERERKKAHPAYGRMGFLFSNAKMPLLVFEVAGSAFAAIAFVAGGVATIGSMFLVPLIGKLGSNKLEE